MRTQLTTLFLVSSAALMLAGCDLKGDDTPAKGPEFSAETEKEVDLKTPSCDSATQGAVALGILGNPGDAFRIIMTCNGQVVARCQAVIAAGANAARCNDGPNAPVPAGPRACRVGPANGNSPQARVQSSVCG